MPDDVACLLSLNTGLILFVIAIIALSTWGILPGWCMFAKID